MKLVDKEALIAAYERLGNVHKAAAELGISHSVAHRRLKAWGLMRTQNLLADVDKEKIRQYYTETKPDDFNLKAFAASMGRTRALISRAAAEMGLSNIRRPKQPAAIAKTGAGVRKAIEERGHPRGFLGSTHGGAAKQKIAAASRETWLKHKASGTGLMSPKNRELRSRIASARMSLLPAEKAYSRAAHGRRPDLGDIYFRSAWEANYARYLNWLIARGEIEKWEYEPETFWFEKIRRGVRSYKPDFRITEKGRTYFVEVKGWMDPKSKTKLKRMRKYFPHIEIRIVDQAAYKAIASSISRLIPNWETRADASRLLRGPTTRVA